MKFRLQTNTELPFRVRLDGHAGQTGTGAQNGGSERVNACSRRSSLAPATVLRVVNPAWRRGHIWLPGGQPSVGPPGGSHNPRSINGYSVAEGRGETLDPRADPKSRGRRT